MGHSKTCILHETFQNDHYVSHNMLDLEHAKGTQHGVLQSTQ